MSFSLTKGASTVVLPNPTLGNKLNYDSGLLSRQSRGGQTRQVRSSSWPVFTAESVTFTGVKQALVDGLRTFLASYPGKKIVVNTNSTDYDAFIQNPDFEFVCDRETSCTNFYTFNLIVVFYVIPTGGARFVTEGGDPLITELGNPLVPEFAL